MLAEHTLISFSLTESLHENLAAQRDETPLTAYMRPTKLVSQNLIISLW